MATKDETEVKNVGRLINEEDSQSRQLSRSNAGSFACQRTACIRFGCRDSQIPVGFDRISIRIVPLQHRTTVFQSTSRGSTGVSKTASFVSETASWRAVMRALKVAKEAASRTDNTQLIGYPLTARPRASGLLAVFARLTERKCEV
jgi:hypothetical protein